MKIFENILISSLTTMRIGGPARYVIEIEEPRDIVNAFQFADTNYFPTYFMGGGANTIGRDEGFLGAIVINRMRGMTDENGLLTIMGGEKWDDVVAYACSRGYTGIEALSKIPGLAAASPVQNIGAYGQDISQVFVSAEVYDIVEKNFKTLEARDFKFGYRKSLLNTEVIGRYFIMSIKLKLSVGQMARPFYNSVERYIAENNWTDFSPQGIREVVSAIRADKLPDPSEKASAGSFFKNVYLDAKGAEAAELKGYPVHRGKDGNKINSGWLIEQAGFKGALINGMRVNPKAALVLINESAGGYGDLAAARETIRGKVYDKFGYFLEQEPIEIINPQIAMTPVDLSGGGIGAPQGKGNN